MREEVQETTDDSENVQEAGDILGAGVEMNIQNMRERRSGRLRKECSDLGKLTHELTVNRRADHKWTKREANARLAVQKEEVKMERRHLALSARALRESATRQVWTTRPVRDHGEASNRLTEVIDVQQPTPSYSFSAFLDIAAEDDTEDETPVVPSVVERVAVDRNEGLGSLDWKVIENKLPDGLQDTLTGSGNSASEAVWCVLENIGTGCPGWNRCGASKMTGKFVQSSGDKRWGARRCYREADDALKVLRQSYLAKAECLRQHRRTGGRGNRIHNEDFNAALDEHNVVLEKEKLDAIGMLARTFIDRGNGTIFERTSQVRRIFRDGVTRRYGWTSSQAFVSEEEV